MHRAVVLDTNWHHSREIERNWTTDNRRKGAAFVCGRSHCHHLTTLGQKEFFGSLIYLLELWPMQALVCSNCCPSGAGSIWSTTRLSVFAHQLGHRKPMGLQNGKTSRCSWNNTAPCLVYLGPFPQCFCQTWVCRWCWRDRTGKKDRPCYPHQCHEVTKCPCSNHRTFWDLLRTQQLYRNVGDYDLWRSKQVIQTGRPRCLWPSLKY